MRNYRVVFKFDSKRIGRFDVEEVKFITANNRQEVLKTLIKLSVKDEYWKNILIHANYIEIEEY